MASTIDNALSKGQRNYARLTGQTVPLFKKMSQGTIKPEELERLKELYREQSEAASATLEAGVKAVKDSAKTATSEAVKRLVKGGKLSSTADIKKMLDASLAIAFQQAAPLIQKAVNEALEKPVERIEDLIKDVRRLQVKADHIFYLLGLDAPNSAKVSAGALMAKSEAKSRHEAYANLVNEKREADEQVTKIAKRVGLIVEDLLARTDKEKESKARRAQQSMRAGGTVDLDINGVPTSAASALELYRQKMGLSKKTPAKKTPSAVKRMTSGFGLFDQKASELLNKNRPVSAQDIYVSDTAQVTSTQSFNKLFGPGVFLDKEQQAAFTRRAESDTGSVLFNKALSLLEKLSGTGFGNLQKRAERAYVEKLKASNTPKEGQKAILQRLQYLRRTKGASEESAQAYERFRKLVMRDLANSWRQSAQDKIDRYKKAVSKHWEGIAKFTRMMGYAFLGATLVNTLNKVFPGWMEKLTSTLGTVIEGVITKAVPWLIKNIGPIIADTFSFIITHLPDIIKGVLKVMGMIVGAVAKAVLSLLGFDKQAEPKQEINQAYYNSQEFKDFAKAQGLTESAARARLETANRTNLDNIDDIRTKEKYQASQAHYLRWNSKNNTSTATVTTNTGSPLHLSPSTTVNNQATLASQGQVFSGETAHVNTIDAVPAGAQKPVGVASGAVRATTTGAKVTADTIPNMMGGDLMVQNAALLMGGD